MSGWTPNPKPIGWDAGAPPDEPEHDDGCQAHQYCECGCACHDDSYYIDIFYRLEEDD